MACHSAAHLVLCVPKVRTPTSIRLRPDPVDCGGSLGKRTAPGDPGAERFFELGEMLAGPQVKMKRRHSSHL